MHLPAALESVAYDVRFGLRQMRRSRGFTLVAVSAIALGIAANSTVFSFLNAVYLRTVSVPEVDRLAALYRVDPRRQDRRASLDAEEYAYYRQSTTTFVDLAAQSWEWTWLARILPALRVARIDPASTLRHE